MKSPDQPQRADFSLEDIFPEVMPLFQPHLVALASDPSILVVLDTNALLLPYTVSKEALPGLREVYEKLAEQERLFIPGRVAREFARLRDRKLSEIIQALNDNRSRINIGDSQIPRILEGISGIQDLQDSAEALKGAKKRYSSSVDALIDQMAAWRGNDPVTSIYANVFRKSSILELSDSREDLSAEWAKRLIAKVPPGYKDSSKEDTGIGDFLIWKNILELGQVKGRDLIFVTGEEKPDWFVRSGGRPVYPRPELVQEFYRYSKGRNVRFSSLHELLKEMSAPAGLVDEVEHAERKASLDAGRTSLSPSYNNDGDVNARLGGFAHFEFPYGGGRAEIFDEGKSFDVEFSEQSKGTLWLYVSGTTVAVAVIGNPPPGSRMSYRVFRFTQRTVSVAEGDVFVVQNAKGETLLGRLKSVRTKGGEHGQMIVDFEYLIFSPGDELVLP